MMTADDAMEIGPSGRPAARINIDDTTVRMPWSSAAEFEERIVRPALAILYRLAVGPGADYYCPRFLHYERTGRSIPGWHWPAFFLPVIWAFYRKLWLPGILFALLPLLGAANLDAIAPALGDSALAWVGITACALWIIPGIVAATLANTLYFHRIRHLVRWAEARTEKRHEVAALLTKRRAASPLGAFVLGGGTLAVVVARALPDLDALPQEFQLRAGVAESLAAVKPLQREIEANWRAFGTFPSQIDYAPVRSYLGAAFLDAVHLSPVNGRLRLLLGPAMSELSGKVILLAPTVDAAQHIQWLCIPVDVPAKYLPAQCRNR